MDNISSPQSLQGITIPIFTFSTVGLLCLLIFSLFHRRFADIYSPRRILKSGRPPRISRSMFSWIQRVYQYEESSIIKTVGLDGAIFLRFLKLGYQLFFILSIFGLLVLAPVNYFSNPPTYPSNSTYFELEAILIQALSLDNIPGQRPITLNWLLTFCWLISFITYSYLLSFYRSYIALKLDNDGYQLEKSKMSKIESRSVMIFGVPRDLRSEGRLHQYFDNLGIGKVDSVVLCRNWSFLQDAVQQRGYYLEQLEILFAQAGKEVHNVVVDDSLDPVEAAVEALRNRYESISDRPTHRNGFLGLFGRKVDTVNEYSRQFESWDERVRQLRLNPEQSAATGVAFVTFESPISAVIASQCSLSTDPFTLLITSAPEPRDVYWPNLSAKSAHSYSKLVRSLLSMSTMVLLVTSSTFVVSGIASLIDLEQLASNFPIFNFISRFPPSVVQFIQGVIPAILLSTWNASLPSVLLVLCQLQGLEAESWIQMSLLSKLFFYQLYNVLFVIPLANTVIWNILINPQKVIERLGEMLPKASTTLLNLIILQGFAIFPAQLLLVTPLFLTYVARIISRQTPRQKSAAYYPSILTFIQYGVLLPGPILVFVIGITYALIQPILLPFCAIFFAIGYFVYKYLLMYVHFPEYDSKGIAATYIVNRCLAGLVIMQLTAMGVLALKSADIESGGQEWSQYAKMVLGILPLLIATYFVYTLINQAHSNQITNVPIEILGKVRRMFMSNTECDPSLQERLSFGSNAGNDSFRDVLQCATDDGAVEDDPLLDYSDLDDYELGDDLMSQHLEPPQTRTIGVLNIPLGAEQEDEPQLNSYLHPAIIGSLPIFWVNELSFAQLRIEQERLQKIYLHRILSQQRLHNSQEVEEEDHGLVSKVRTFFDQATTWTLALLS